MNNNEMDCYKKLQLLSEYMSIYIQILPQCHEFGGIKMWRSQIPTFQYFCETYTDERYSLVMQRYKESIDFISKDKLYKQFTAGLGTSNGVAYRFYNYWKGCKYYLPDNFTGQFKLDQNNTISHINKNYNV